MRKSKRFKNGPALSYGAERLRDYMAKRELTQTELARFLGMTEPHLSRLLNGIKGVGVATAVRIQEKTGAFVVVEDFLRVPTASLRPRATA